MENECERPTRARKLRRLTKGLAQLNVDARVHFDVEARLTKESQPAKTVYNKADLVDWILVEVRGVVLRTYDDYAVLKRVEPINSCSRNKPKPVLFREQMSIMCDILLLPVSHSELNRIEPSRADVKGFVAKKNVAFSLSDVGNHLEYQVKLSRVEFTEYFEALHDLTVFVCAEQATKRKVQALLSPKDMEGVSALYGVEAPEQSVDAIPQVEQTEPTNCGYGSQLDAIAFPCCGVRFPGIHRCYIFGSNLAIAAS